LNCLLITCLDQQRGKHAIAAGLYNPLPDCHTPFHFSHIQNNYIASQAPHHSKNCRMPRLSAIFDFVSICSAILLAFLFLESIGRQDAAKLNADIAERNKRFFEFYYDNTTLWPNYNHIFRSPWSAHCGLCQVLQRCCWIPENCGPDQMWIEVDAGVVALCELSGVSSTCDASTSIPANVLASLTTTGESDVSISATTNRNSLETGSLKTRDGTE